MQWLWKDKRDSATHILLKLLLLPLALGMLPTGTAIAQTFFPLREFPSGCSLPAWISRSCPELIVFLTKSWI
jgi:hypothetical protein